ncbi:MAG TPA: PEGA domain-containing protein, partial [Planctomycetota bacterium]|nr:PEGA domain-containing protein [Planctomycetota bacterium]
VTSEPSGALVRLDEDVIGTTPLAYEFENFGRRRLSLYLPGYQTYSEPLHLKTPWHATFPIDVITEVLLPLGLRYKKEVNVVLLPDDGERVLETLGSFVKRAEALREGLPGQIPTGEPIVEPAQPDPEAPVEPDPATADKP